MRFIIADTTNGLLIEGNREDGYEVLSFRDFYTELKGITLSEMTSCHVTSEEYALLDEEYGIHQL